MPILPKEKVRIFVTYDEANIKAKRLFDEWRQKREVITQEAKKKSIWVNIGLDSNEYLFKELDNEHKEKLEKLKNSIS